MPVYKKSVLGLSFFYFSTDYTENNLRYLIQILHIHVTGHRQVPCNKVILNSKE